MEEKEMDERITAYFKKKGLPLTPALTFEDVTIVDLYSDISSRSSIEDTGGRLAKNIFLKTPIVSANMDMITESQMAIAMARLGGGSVCKTRLGPGVGIPQISAVAECCAVAGKYNIPVMADGGIKTSSDLAKILVAGANLAMLGGLLAGTEETPGKPFYEDGEKWKIYRGSASIEFQLSRVDREERDDFIRTPEGVPKRVKYKGEVALVVDELMGHLRSAMSYVGAWNMKELHEKGKFKWQTLSGYAEGKPHDVS